MRVSFDLRDCITNEAGDPVSWDEGDCDDDGTKNLDEVNNDETPCGEPAPDAGPSDYDGGPSQEDAGMVMPEDAGGAGVDGGSTGPGIDPRFEGGGGCACRATPGRSEAPLALALLALGLFVRRRGR